MQPWYATQGEGVTDEVVVEQPLFFTKASIIGIVLLMGRVVSASP